MPSTLCTSVWQRGRTGDTEVVPQISATDFDPRPQATLLQRTRKGVHVIDLVSCGKRGKYQNRNHHIQKTAGTIAHHRFTELTVPLMTHLFFHRPYVVY